MRPWRIGTSSGTRVALWPSRIPTGSGRASDAAHLACASSGTDSRSARPSAMRAATAFGTSSTPRRCFLAFAALALALALAGFALFADFTAPFAISLHLRPDRGVLASAVTGLVAADGTDAAHAIARRSTRGTAAPPTSSPAKRPPASSHPGELGRRAGAGDDGDSP